MEIACVAVRTLLLDIVRRGRLSLEETAFYMAELIEAVDAIHVAMGAIHRDLKPATLPTLVALLARAAVQCQFVSPVWSTVDFIQRFGHGAEWNP